MNKRFEVASVKSGDILGTTFAESADEAVRKVMATQHDEKRCKVSVHFFHVRQVGVWETVEWKCKEKHA